MSYDDDALKAQMSAEDYEVARTTKNGRFFWKNVYGAPMDKTNKAAQNMNENPELGSFWKGRILMQVFAVKTEKPVYKVLALNEADCEYSRQFMEVRKFRFMVQVNSAIALPVDDTKYEIAVRIADKEITTGEAVFNKGSYNRFNYRSDVDIAMFEGPYLNIEDIGSVFVYLKKKFKIGGVKNICYYRGHSSEF